jgi:hypothetical protein
VGGSAGYSTWHNVNVTSGAASGTTGFGSGLAVGAVLGNDLYRHLGGEVRYDWIQNDLQVSSGSTKVTAAGQSHAIHYDLLVHTSAGGESVRPFAAFGAGVKYYRGTGSEPAFQPLSNLVLLTHTSEAQPLISAGGGVKFPISHRLLIRVDFRDYVTPYPSSLLALPPNSRANGWVHDFVITLGISGLF